MKTKNILRLNFSHNVQSLHQKYKRKAKVLQSNNRKLHNYLLTLILFKLHSLESHNTFDF